MRPRSSGNPYGKLELVNETARARSEFYGLLSELLSFPTEELVAACRVGAIRSAAENIAASLPYRLAEEPFAGLDEPCKQFFGELIRQRSRDVLGRGPNSARPAGYDEFLGRKREQFAEEPVELASGPRGFVHKFQLTVRVAAGAWWHPS